MSCLGNQKNRVPTHARYNNVGGRLAQNLACAECNVPKRHKENECDTQDGPGENGADDAEGFVEK